MTYSLELADLLSVFAIKSDDRQLVVGLTLDSRKVKPGYLFFACKGAAADGRDYVNAAVSSGAIAIIYEAEDAVMPSDLGVSSFAVFGLASMVGHAASVFYREPSKDLQVFGVTGTNGKTTCCYLLVQALKILGMKAGMIGTIGVGDVDELEKSGLTTPDPISLQQSLANMRDDGFTQVAMEVSSHALDQDRVNGVAFFCTQFTNLTHDHLDYHGTLEEYWLAKQRLFTEFQSELVVANASDQYGSRIIDVANSEFIVQYGAAGDVFAEDVVLGQNGISLTIEGNGVEFELNTGLIGKINVPNIELLVATLLALSTSVQDIKKVVGALESAPGRMEVYRAEDSAQVVVDYAHTPDALEKALESVRAHCAGQLWCVFGCGGDRDEAKRPIMGAAAAKVADCIIITNDNPRNESAADIAQEIRQGVGAHDHCEIILDRASAIAKAVSQANSEDWVLVAGKGHESTQTIGREVLPFSDREFVKSLLTPVDEVSPGVVE